MVAAVAVANLLAGQPDPRVTIAGATAEQHEMAEWAIGRFEAVGLTLPRIEIRFHVDHDSCHGHLAYYGGGVADMCYVHADPMAARSLLHEMAHGWLDVNVTGVARDRFLALRGLTTWNGKQVPWDERGFEQGAEIIAWAIGDQGEGVLMPSIPNNAPQQLVDTFELLTGRRFPELSARTRWHGSAQG